MIPSWKGNGHHVLLAAEESLCWTSRFMDCRRLLRDVLEGCFLSSLCCCFAASLLVFAVILIVRSCRYKDDDKGSWILLNFRFLVASLSNLPGKVPFAPGYPILGFVVVSLWASVMAINSSLYSVLWKQLGVEGDAGELVQMTWMKNPPLLLVVGCPHNHAWRWTLFPRHPADISLRK